MFARGTLGAPTPVSVSFDSPFLHVRRKQQQSTHGKRARRLREQARKVEERSRERLQRAMDPGSFAAMTEKVAEDVRARLPEKLRIARVHAQLYEDTLRALPGAMRQRDRVLCEQELRRVKARIRELEQEAPVHEVRRRAAVFLESLTDGIPLDLAEAASEPARPTIASIFGGAPVAPRVSVQWADRAISEFQAVVQGQRPPVETAHHDICPTCRVPMVLQEHTALLTCDRCGHMVQHIDTTMANVGYGDEYDVQVSAYQKRAHLNDCLNKVQGRETSRVQEEVIEQVRRELRRRWTKLEGDNIRTATRDQVWIALRALKLTKVYEHLMQVHHRITGVEPPKFEPQQLARLRTMFEQTLEPFERHRNTFAREGRQNFLSYKYVINKLCILCGWDEHAKYFNTPIGSDRLRYHESVFAAICRDLGWQFVPDGARTGASAFASSARGDGDAAGTADAEEDEEDVEEEEEGL